MSTAFDPKTAKPVSASTKSVEAFDPTTAKPVEEVASRGLKGWVQDAAATGVKAALAVPEAAVGLADLATGGKAGKALEGAGVRFKDAREIAEGWHSDVTKAQKAEFQNADGVAGKAAVALSNPSLIAMAVGESLGAMGAGGAIGRGAMAATRLGQMGAKGAAIAGAAGEGVVGAGSAAEQIRQETADGELTAKQAALAAGTGLATGALGFAGNKVANRLGIGDADMMLAQGTKGMAKDAAERATAAAVNPLAQPAQKSILRQMGEGAITEGVLEELPQSVSEQILQNEALGKSWSEGLDDAIVMGILSGGAMGAGAAGYRGFKDKQNDDAAANARKAAANVPGAATGQDSAAGDLPPAQWTTSAGAAARAEPGTAPASPANAPNLDYETLPGAAPEAIGKEIPFEREFDTGGLSLQSTQPAAAAPVLDHDALRDKAGVMMPPQLDSGRIEVATGLQPLSNEQPPRQWDTGNLSLVDESQPQVPLSQRMGLNPKAGALSKAAAMAVDSGASPVGQPQVAPMAEQQAAPQVPAGVDPETGEVSLQAQMDELKSRIAFMQQQGAAQGWDRNRAAQRNALQTQLTKLELQAVKASSNPQTFRGGVSNPNGDGFEWTPERLAFAKKMIKQVEFGIETGIGVRQIAQRVQFPAGTTIEERERFVRQAADRFGLVIPESRTDEEEMASQMEERREARHDLIPTGGRAAIPGTDDIRFMSSEDLADYREKIRQDAKAGVLGAKKASLAAWEEQAARLDELKQRKLAGALSVDPVKQVSQAAGAAQAAVGKAAQIAREGNAEREAQRQRQLDASERWTRMTTAERQAVAATAPGLTVIARKNVHTRAWPDLGEKIREKLLDSLVAPLAESTSKAPAAIENAAKPAPNAVSGDAQPKPAAHPVGDEKPFAAETGTLGIPRAEMPQVPTANHGGLVKHLNAQGIAHETTTVVAAQLKPTQAEYSPSKVEAAKTATGDRALIVSSDGHIIDGHHQAVAAAEEGKQVKAIVLDAPVEQALAAVKASPSANTEAVAAPLPEPVTVPKSIPQRMKEAKAAKEATTKPAPNDGQRKQDLTSAQELVQGQIENRERQRNEAWARVKQLRAAVKEGTANRLQLLKAEDAHRSLVREVDGMRAKEDPRFRRQESEQLAGAAFDVASFLQGMGEGQPANVSAAAVPAVNVRPSYSPAARAEAVRAIKGTADAIRKAWANGPEVIVAFDMHDAVVPESARRADLKQRSGGARGAPEGFYYQGKVYLMASKLKTPNDAARVLFHEALGHHGLRGLFGKDLGLILNQVATMRKADVDAKIAEYGLRRVNRLDRRTAAEEVLAEMAQNTPQIGFVRRAVAAIRTWLRANVPGFKSLALTDAELIRNFILPARAWVERGGVDGGNKADATFSREAAPELRVATNFMQARQAVKEFQGKPLTNDATGMTAVLARNSLDKMLSGKAVEKSETPATHAMAVANADSLFKQAILGWSKPDRSDDANIKAIHRFFAPMEVNGRTKLVKLTVKEGMRSDRGNPLYTVEAVELNENRPGLEWIEAAAREDGVSVEIKNPLQRGVGRRDSQQAGPRATLAQPHGMNPGRSAEDVHSLAQEVERSNSAQPKDGGPPNRRVSRAGAGAPGRSGSNDSGDGFTVSESREPGKGSVEHVADERHGQGAKENLLKPRGSSVDAKKASERSGSTSSGDRLNVVEQQDVGKGSTEEVADEPDRLLTLDTKKSLDRRVSRTDTMDSVERSGSNDSGDESTLAKQHGVDKAATDEGMEDDEPMFSRSRFADLKDSALDQLTKTFTHEGKVSLWDKSVGTMRHLAERAPSFKPVYESAQQNIDDVSMLANDAADMAPRILPRVESLGDLKKKPVSAVDNKAVARPLFEGTLIWARDENGKPTLVDDLQKRYANLSAHNKAAMLLKHGKIKSEVLVMWQGLPVAQFEKLINSRFENKMLKPGIVWTDAELQAQFGTDANQISLYREARAAIDRSIDMTARTDMLRVVGEKYEPMRDAVLAQPSVEAAAQLLLDTLEQDAKADPDSRERLAGYMQLISRRLDTAVDLQQGGYAPLSRFGRYTVDVVDANGERLYFGMYETARDSNRAKMQLAQEFQDATITTGTMSAEAYKLFAGVTPETLEQFGEMLGLKAEGNEAQDKAFQEFLKLTKNNHSAMKRLIHRKGIAGFSEDVGRVVANFVYSNARAGAMGLNAGKMETAIGKIPKEQGELKDLAMGLRDYIRDPQEEGQAVRGMLFAQYLGGSIASAFVNTTQPFAVTLPWLSQYGGMKKAGAQLARALKDMGRSVADKGFKYEADLAKALQSAEDDGVVSPQEIHQLMAQARGAGMLRSGDGTKAGDLRAKAGNLWEQGKVLWGQPFALAEQFNRRSTFIASYRIAKDQGMADPAEFARKAVLETQFVYSKAAKPKWARGAVGGTLFTFKTYSVSYLELMQRMWTQGGPEGKRAVGWALAMLLLMSGAGGVPFMEDAEDLIDGAGQMMGYNISAKQWRKELLANVVGKELGEFMEQGLSGLPGAPIDVSGRLGMGNLLPGTGLFLNKPNRERDLMEIVGPAGDLVARGFTGARNLLGGDVAGAALEVSPTAVRNLAKGADMAATGMYRDTKGYKVIDTTLAEAAAKAIGFQPKSVAEVQEANSFMQRSKSFYTQTSSEIKAQWADALFRKDEAAVQRVRERLAAWNRDNPEQPIVVKMPDVWKRVREMGKDRSDRIADTAPKALRERMREIAASNLQSNLV